MSKYVVGIGEALWDMLPEGKQLGGAPANFAYHTSQFGFESRIVTAVGGDILGDEMLDTLRRKRLNGIIEKVDYPTGTVEVKLDAAGIPQYDISEDVAWDNIPFTPQLESLARDTRAVCFGSLAQRSLVSCETINRFLDAMPDGEGQYRIFDINLRQRFYNEEVIRTALDRCNILKINDEELDVLGRLFNCDNGDTSCRCRFLMNKYHIGILILTCGVKGSYVFTPDTVSFFATPNVEVADTVGAGDSFTAAFTAALLSGRTVRQAHRLAVDTSAFVCSQHGAMPVLPRELLNRME